MLLIQKEFAPNVEQLRAMIYNSYDINSVHPAYKNLFTHIWDIDIQTSVLEGGWIAFTWGLKNQNHHNVYFDGETYFGWTGNPNRVEPLTPEHFEGLTSPKFVDKKTLVRTLSLLINNDMVDAFSYNTGGDHAIFWIDQDGELHVRGDLFMGCPIFYVDNIAVSSDLDILSQIHNYWDETPKEYVEEFIEKGFSPSGYTIHSGIRALRQGHEYSSSVGETKFFNRDFFVEEQLVQLYHCEDIRNLKFKDGYAEESAKTFDIISGLFCKLFDMSVRANVEALDEDEEVNVTLSGGIDSSLLFASLANNINEGYSNKIHAFNLDLNDNDYNERGEHYGENLFLRFMDILNEGSTFNKISPLLSKNSNSGISDLMAIKFMDSLTDMGGVVPTIDAWYGIRQSKGNQGIIKIFDGSGPDELLGSYRRAAEYDSQLHDTFTEMSCSESLKLGSLARKLGIDLVKPYCWYPIVGICLLLPWIFRRHNIISPLVGPTNMQQKNIMELAAELNEVSSEIISRKKEPFVEEGHRQSIVKDKDFARNRRVAKLELYEYVRRVAQEGL